MSPLTFGAEPSPLMAWSSYSSESAMLTFCRRALSKLACPDGTTATDRDPQGPATLTSLTEPLRGFLAGVPRPPPEVYESGAEGHTAGGVYTSRFCLLAESLRRLVSVQNLKAYTPAAVRLVTPMNTGVF